MISENLKILVGYRLIAGKYGSLASIFDWDMEKREFKVSQGYVLFNIYLLIFVGVCYVIMMLTWLLQKDLNGADNEIGIDQELFSYVFGWLYIGFVSTLVIMTIRLINYRPQIVYVMNQMFRYDEEIEVEVLAIMLAIGSLIVPWVMVSYLSTNVEPTHAMVKEWLEVDISFTPEYFPLILVVALGVTAAGGVIFVFLISALYYVVFLMCYTTSMFPIHSQMVITPGTRRIIEYRMETKYFEFSHVLLETGMLISLAIVSCWIGIALIVFVESANGGAVIDKSDAFVNQCRHLLIRRSGLRKFALSCPRLLLDFAYPFYKVHRNTFLEFVMQGVDFTITLVTRHNSV
ncbi:unnamed protein product [Orchesella dallaii]|uniref:Odorant receptor n=1 Tax=Orchesella dallaii TaxID=48710 RepID=A0ABP1RUP4_9HEXA